MSCNASVVSSLDQFTSIDFKDMRFVRESSLRQQSHTIPDNTIGITV